MSVETTNGLQETPKTAPQKFCFACGEQVDPRAEICPKCGVRQKNLTNSNNKNRITAAILALVLGGIGIHRFYLGNTGLGLLYLVFFWTFIPAIVAFVEFLIFLFMSDEEFDRSYNSGA
ncbi:MAG: NINE protein [Rhizobiales bacterium]|nr:NINE protein [Hyphomicrobiales bacterium]